MNTKRLNLIDEHLAFLYDFFKKVLLTENNDGWTHSKKRKNFLGITGEYLSGYSPELKFVGRLWTLFSLEFISIFKQLMK